jgi:D-3-phosphoglycerate dehydrogenase
MSDSVVEALILDLLEWLASGERSYLEVMDAWRTSCPKLPVWEDANDRGLVAESIANGHRIVRVTALGAALLNQHKVGHALACPKSARAPQ